MSSWAKVGAKVVCITDRWAEACDVQKGEVYTIAGMTTLPSYGLFLRFKGLPVTDFYNANGFRPLVTQSDDIAMFQRLADMTAAQNSIQVSEDA